MKTLAAILLATFALAQTPVPAGPQTPARGGGRRQDYPDRTAAGDPEAVARGKALYGVHCNFCHGSDARGGEGGPNLIRSKVVLDDKNGELIAPIVQGGRPERGMPALQLNASQVSDVAAYIHSFKVGGYDISRKPPPSVLVGDAKAGEAAFAKRCASCHKVDGDLKGFGAKFTEPKTLQQTWLIPGPGRGGRGGGEAPATNVPPTTVSVSLPSGKVEGRLVRIDDFLVTLTLADGTQRTIRREGDNPRVEVHDPLLPHRELLRVYTDKEIHDLTAYLVTLK